MTLLELWSIVYPLITFLFGLWVCKEFREVDYFDLVDKVDKAEGKKKQVNRAQVSEVVSLTLKFLGIKAKGKRL